MVLSSGTRVYPCARVVVGGERKWRDLAEMGCRQDAYMLHRQIRSDNYLCLIGGGLVELECEDVICNT